MLPHRWKALTELVNVGHLVCRLAQGQGDTVFLLHLLGACVIERRQARHARCIAQGRRWAESGEVHNASNTILAILLNQVVDDLCAACAHKVQVSVRQVNTVWIDKALKQQVEPNRINVCDVHEVRNQRTTDRTAAWADHDAVIFGPLDDLLHQQEVARESHLLDNVQLERKAISVDHHICRRWDMTPKLAREAHLPALHACTNQRSELVFCHFWHAGFELLELVGGSLDHLAHVCDQLTHQLGRVALRAAFDHADDLQLLPLAAQQGQVLLVRTGKPLAVDGVVGHDRTQHVGGLCMLGACVHCRASNHQLATVGAHMGDGVPIDAVVQRRVHRDQLCEIVVLEALQERAVVDGCVLAVPHAAHVARCNHHVCHFQHVANAHARHVVVVFSGQALGQQLVHRLHSEF